MTAQQTYNEWQADGYQVKKGEKAVDFNENGESVFDEDQVFDPSDPDSVYELHFD